MAPTEPDPQKMLSRTLEIATLFRGANVSAMVCLGVRLGLYPALRDAGNATSEELANRTGLQERWLREWLRGQAAAGIVEHKGDERYELSPETSVLLAETDNLSYLGNHFDAIPYTMAKVEPVTESFRTGIGYTTDDHGPNAAAVTEGLFGNWYRQALVPKALPLLDGVVETLKAGATAADVGCGSGVAAIEMAKAFPRSQFHGYDISTHALARAEANRAGANISNASFHNVEREPLADDGSIDFISTFDCLHDMTRPHETAAAIRKAIRPDGVWFIVDINGGATLEENMNNPMAAMLYAASVLSCMSSGLSEPGGAGLGTLGLPEPAMRELVTEAGFTRFRRLDLPNPINAYYEARP